MLTRQIYKDIDVNIDTGQDSVILKMRMDVSGPISPGHRGSDHVCGEQPIPAGERAGAVPPSRTWPSRAGRPMIHTAAVLCLCFADSQASGGWPQAAVSVNACSYALKLKQMC